jgi:predicted RNase H-like HicB family nuclease
LEYNAIVQEEPDGGFSGWVPSLPGCASQGETFEEVINNLKEAIQLYLEESPNEDLNEGQNQAKQYLVPIRISHV